MLYFVNIHALPAPFSIEMGKDRMEVDKGGGVGRRILRREGRRICTQDVKYKKINMSLKTWFSLKKIYISYYKRNSIKDRNN